MLIKYILHVGIVCYDRELRNFAPTLNGHQDTCFSCTVGTVFLAENARADLIKYVGAHKAAPISAPHTGTATVLHQYLYLFLRV